MGSEEDPRLFAYLRLGGGQAGRHSVSQHFGEGGSGELGVHTKDPVERKAVAA